MHKQLFLGVIAAVLLLEIKMFLPPIYGFHFDRVGLGYGSFVAFYLVKLEDKRAASIS